MGKNQKQSIQRELDEEEKWNVKEVQLEEEKRVAALER